MTFPSLRRASTRGTQPGTPTDTTSPDAPDAPDAGPARSRARRPLLIGGLAAALALTGGTVAVAGAHKTVTLDIDGATTTVSTFAGSVGGVLDAHDLQLGPRDLVAPAPGTALASGDEIVVRTARQVVALVDGEETHVWVTALDAEEALGTLMARGDDVRLVASRSAERADLGIRLDTEGPVDVVVDGDTHEVADASVGLQRVLEGLGVELGPLDRVQVHQVEAEGAARLTVTVQRVVAEEQSTVAEVPFEKVVEDTDELYRGQSETAVAGEAGERTTVHRVVLVDGVEESRVLLSDGVTREPVTEVVRRGTKERPAPPPPPAPRTTTSSGSSSSSSSSGSSSSSSSSSSGSSSSTVSGDVWAALAQCESGGNPTIVSSNGLYYGLYQFSLSTWQSVGGTGLPSEASPAEQTQRAQILQARSGWGQWPACASKLGLL
ncbi:MAG: transglycosylase family protein [Actinotalea sp.]|nr:transglycosylase family protein [Actinotalea sp.]